MIKKNIYVDVIFSLEMILQYITILKLEILKFNTFAYYKLCELFPLHFLLVTSMNFIIFQNTWIYNN